MNEYKQMAKAFLKQCGAKMKIEYTGTERNPDWGDGYLRDTYNVVIRKGRKWMRVKF